MKNSFLGLAIAVEFAELLPSLAARREVQRVEDVARAAHGLRVAGDEFGRLAAKMDRKPGEDLSPDRRRARIAFERAAGWDDEAPIRCNAAVWRVVAGQLYLRRDAIDAVFRGGDSLAVANLGRELHQAASVVEAFSNSYVQDQAEAMRGGATGRPVNMAMRTLLEWAESRGVGMRDLARALVAAGIPDDETWVPASVSVGAEAAAAAWEGRLKVALHRLRKRRVT